MPAKRQLVGAALAAKKRKLELEQEQEKEQRNPVDELLESVQAALQSGMDEVPAAVTQMLIPMLPGSLGVFREERHRYQTDVVDMVGNVLAKQEGQLLRSIEEIEGKIAGAAVVRVSREAAVSAAQKDLEEKKQEANTKKHTLADDAKAYKVAKEAVAAAKSAQTVAEKDIQATVSKKDLLASAITNFVKPLTEGTAGADERGRLATSLMSVLVKFSLDASMMTALPSALTKEPSNRGPFDTTLVAQLDEATTIRLSSLNHQLREAETIKEKHAADVKLAEAAFDVASLKQVESAEAFQAARASQKSSEDALAAATKALQDLDPEVAKFQKALTAAQEELRSFVEEPKKAFQTLSQRVAPPPELPAPEVEANTEAQGTERS